MEVLKYFDTLRPDIVKNLFGLLENIENNSALAIFLKYFNSFLSVNNIYQYIDIGKFRYTPMHNSKYKFETLVWQLMKGLTPKLALSEGGNRENIES